jgi:hypothetical protein
MFEPNDRRQKPENAYTKFIKYFSLVMTLLYPALGLYLIFSSPEQIHLDPTLKKTLGGILIVYGAFRFYRAYQQYFKHPNH